MQNAITAYDFSAIMILLVGLAYYLRTNRERTLRYNVIVYVMLGGIVGGVADILRVSFAQDGLAGGIHWKCFNGLYFACVSLMAPLYILYIIGVTDTWHLLVNKRREKLMAFLPTIISLAVSALGVFTNALAYVDDKNEISYGWGYVLVNAIIILYIAMAIRYIVTMGRYIDFINEIQMIIPLAIMSAALIFQVYWPDHHVICLSVAINCLVLILINRRSEEALDVTTGMHSYWLFSHDMRLRIRTGKNMNLILVNIVNYEHALRILGYDEMIELMRFFSMEMIRILQGYKKKFLCYNSGGKYAIEVAGVNMKEIQDIAGAIVKYINANMRLGGSDFEIKINTCVAKCPEDIDDIDSLFMLISDLDLFPVQNRVLSASEITGTKEFVVKKEMNTILDKAITNNYFSVYYQPIYDTKEKRFASAEALIRLKDPKHGFISPGVFIPIAEKSGMIHKIGSFVIDEVCKFIASDDFKKLNVDYIEINLSVMQCLRMDLADEIISKAAYYEIDPSTINLEITETASSYSQEKIFGNVMALDRAGFTFSLDDFGTGYSNLMRVTSLPLDIIKLDRTFVLLMEKGNSRTVIQNIILMIKDMGKKVLVEGIETKEMVDVFTEMGVDEIQGFYFSKPLCKEDYIAFNLENNNIES